MKIVQFTAANVKRLTAVSITPDPDGNMIVIGGDNGNGKTSVLDSIAMVIGGADRIPAHPIHTGASKAQIVIETEEFVATRTFSAKGSQLVVKDKKGVTLSSPQALLDSLTSRVSFDPLAFTRMPAKEQAETLRQLVGLDFSKLKADYEFLFAQRTDVNRDLKTQQARLEGMKKHPFTPKQPVEQAEVLARLKAANEKNTKNASRRVQLTLAKDRVQTAWTALRAAQEALMKAETEHENASESMGKLNEEVESLKDIDTAAIGEELAQIEETNRHVRENAQLVEETAKATALAAEAAEFTAKLEAIRQQKEDMLAKAKFPVEGLNFTAEGVTYNGVTFAEASAAEQLRISVAMGFAMSPKLKVALIRDGSLLDDRNLALIAEIAEEHDGQVWLERVGKGEECTVIIEDGQVEESN